MFPNPHDALPLPPHPNLDQYKKRAKDLLKASQSTDPAAIRTWAAEWIASLVRLIKPHYHAAAPSKNRPLDRRTRKLRAKGNATDHVGTVAFVRPAERSEAIRCRNPNHRPICHRPRPRLRKLA